MSWNSSSYNGYYFNSTSAPSTYPNFDSDDGMPAGLIFLIVIFAFFFIVGITRAAVRYCGGDSSLGPRWGSSQPPPPRTISLGANNTYPNHVIDVRSQSHYVQIASTPQSQLESIPLAVPVPSAPSAPGEGPMVTLQIDTISSFERTPAFEPERPVVAIGSLPAAQHPAIIASRLPFDELTIHVLMSKGGYSRVYRGTFRGETVAIKKLLPEDEKNLQQVTAFLHEITLMATLNHPHLVQYVGVSWDNLREVCAVTEFMEGGDLRAALTQFQTINRPQGLDSQKGLIALQVAQALAYLHSQYPKVLHRDLKSRNILLDKTQMLAKVTDFGVSRGRGDCAMAAVGTLLWMAPEVMTGECYDDKADIFSFGVVLSELDTHAMPYADVKAQMVSESGRPLPDTALLQRIMTGRVSVTFSDALDESVMTLATSCLSLDPRSRPSARQVVFEIEKILRRM